MENLLVMSVFNGKTNLGKPVKDLIFSKISCTSLSILYFGLIFYLRLEVTIVAVVHDDAKLALFCFVHFSKTSNVGMV